jgi:hypothetical protein
MAKRKVSWKDYPYIKQKHVWKPRYGLDTPELVGDFKADPASSWMQIKRKYPVEFFDPRDFDHTEAKSSTELVIALGIVLLGIGIATTIYILKPNPPTPWGLG